MRFRGKRGIIGVGCDPQVQIDHYECKIGLIVPQVWPGWEVGHARSYPCPPLPTRYEGVPTRGYAPIQPPLYSHTVIFFAYLYPVCFKPGHLESVDHGSMTSRSLLLSTANVENARSRLTLWSHGVLGVYLPPLLREPGLTMRLRCPPIMTDLEMLTSPLRRQTMTCVIAGSHQDHKPDP